MTLPRDFHAYETEMERKEKAKLAEFGDFLSATCRNVVALVGCDYSRACELVRAFKSELLTKFVEGLAGSETTEMEA